VVVDDPKRPDLLSRLLQVDELDDEITGFAPEQDDRAHAGGDPARAVDVG
jgi:hypothetical protein